MEEVKWTGNQVTSVDWASYPILRFPDVPKVITTLYAATAIVFASGASVSTLVYYTPSIVARGGIEPLTSGLGNKNFSVEQLKCKK